MNGISGQQELVQKYASRLAVFEGQIAALREKQRDLAAENTRLQTALDEGIEKMTF